MRSIVTAAFDHYLKWWMSPNLKKPICFTPGLLPGDFSATIETRSGVRLGVLGLNTAFLQLGAGDYHGKLALGIEQFHACCEGDGPAWCARHDLRFLITHHPPDWLSDEARQVLCGEIATPGRFAAHLFGHLHDGRSRTVSTDGAKARREWQAYSLFGLEHFAESGAKFERRHGFFAGRIELGDKRAQARLWPRRASRREDGHWKVIPDHERFDLEEDQGTAPEELAYPDQRVRTRADREGSAPTVSEAVPPSAPPMLAINPAQQQRSNPPDLPVLARHRWEITVQATLTDLTESRVHEILASLRALSGDAELHIRRITQGSVKVELETTDDAGQLLQHLFEQGQFREVMGMRVLAVRRCDVTPVGETYPANVVPIQSNTAISQTREGTGGGMSEQETDVFLSYNSEDSPFVHQLAHELRSRGIILWLDEEQLRPGVAWQPELEAAIKRAKTVAVLIGPHGSGPWQNEEIRAALQLAVQDNRPVIPVILPGLQGDPKLPAFLAVRTHIDLRSGVDDGIRRLCWGITGKRGVPAASTRMDLQVVHPRIRPPMPMVTLRPSMLPTVTIQLDFSTARDAVNVTYHQNPYGPVDQATFVDSNRLRALERAAVDATLFSGNHPDSIGLCRALFDLLFPGDAWNRCAVRLWHTAESPPRNPVRIRIVTSSPVLASLAWFATTWTDPVSPSGTAYPMIGAGWTFEVSAGKDPARHSIVLPAPCRVLVIQSLDGVGNDPQALTLNEIREALERLASERVKPEYFATASSPAEISRQIHEFHPHLLLFFGSCENNREGQPCLQLLGNEWLSLRELVADCSRASRTPYLLYLGLLSSASSRIPERNSLTAVCLDHGHLKQLPAVLVDRGIGSTAVLADRMMRFLYTCLGGSSDPVTAVANVANDPMTLGSTSCQVFTAYEHWKTEVLTKSSHVAPRGVMELDRWVQRALVLDRVNKLVDSGRVAAIVAYGEPGNRIDWFSAQALACLDDAKSKVCAKPLVLSLLSVIRSNPRRILHKALELELRSELDLSAQISLGPALRQYVGPGSSRAPLLWLNWGTIANIDDAEWVIAQLSEWLTFCAALTIHCEDGMRIASYLAIEASASHHDRLVEAISDCSTSLLESNPHFACVRLEPLKHVSYDELINFLRDRADCNCPDPAHFAKRLRERTRGQYAQLVDWIRRAEEVGWDRVRRELESPTAPNPSEQR